MAVITQSDRVVLLLVSDRNLNFLHHCKQHISTAVGACSQYTNASFVYHVDHYGRHTRILESRITKKRCFTNSSSFAWSKYSLDFGLFIQFLRHSLFVQIKRLKARATNGDEMTLTLVRDLQTQLHHFEKQLLEAGRKKRTNDIGSQSAPETGYILISFELL